MKILIIDDDQGVRNLLTEFITELNHTVQAKATGEEGLVEFGRTDYDLLFLDLQMPGMDGFEVLRRIKEINNDAEVIIITAFGSVSSAIEALNMGAYAYINKPFDFQELERIIERVKELIELRQAYRLLANERLRSFHIDNLIAVSPTMRTVKQQIVELSEIGSSVLLIGEPGSGKRFVSRILHFSGKGKESLIIQLNAEDIETFLEKGKFRHSDGITLARTEFPRDLIRQGYGTVILNGLNDLSPGSINDLCALLNQVFPPSSPKESYRGFRLIALLEIPHHFTDPEILISESLWGFFSDIIRIPPLRYRNACIVPLAQLFFQNYVAEKGGRNFYISQPVREFLRLYDWPGNISELKIIVDRLAAICTSRLVSAKDLETVQKDYKEYAEKPGFDLGGILTQAERSLINKTFRQKDIS